jgi:hypothetical protein
VGADQIGGLHLLRVDEPDHRQEDRLASRSLDHHAPAPRQGAGPPSERSRYMRETSAGQRPATKGGPNSAKSGRRSERRGRLATRGSHFGWMPSGQRGRMERGRGTREGAGVDGRLRRTFPCDVSRDREHRRRLPVHRLGSYLKSAAQRVASRARPTGHSPTGAVPKRAGCVWGEQGAGGGGGGPKKK